MDNREVIERMSISGLLDVLNTGISLSTCHMEYAIQSNVLEDLVKCLEELEQYRELGTVEEAKQFMSEVHRLVDSEKMLVEYIKLGTLEQVREAVALLNLMRRETR